MKLDDDESDEEDEQENDKVRNFIKVTETLSFETE